MKKKMVKRLLALVLALALCTSLMLPGFAAVEQSNELVTLENDACPNCGRNDWGEYILKRYEYYNPTYHTPYYTITPYCHGCGYEKITYTSRQPVEPHNDGYYCTLCNHRIQ